MTASQKTRGFSQSGLVYIIFDLAIAIADDWGTVCNILESGNSAINGGGGAQRYSQLAVGHMTYQLASQVL